MHAKLTPVSLLLLSTMYAAPALAQQPPLPPPPDTAEPTAPPPPLPPAGTYVLPSMTTQAAEEPVAPVVVGAYQILVPEHFGVASAEAHTVATLVGRELERQSAPAGSYEIRLGKLGSKTLFSVTRQDTKAERNLLITSLDEVPVATPRLVEALVTSRTVGATGDTDNVVRQEARRPLTKTTSPGAYLGLIGMGSIGAPTAVSAGVDVGLSFRNGQLELAGHGRAGGVGNSDSKTSFASLDLGANYNLTTSETSPFVGGGVAFGYFNVQADERYRAHDGSGLGAFVDVGLSLFRSSHVGATASLRADVPFYALKSKEYNDAGRRDSAYVVPVSLNLGLAFH